MRVRAFIACSLLAACLPVEADREGLWRAGIAEVPVSKFSPAGGVVDGFLYVIGGPSGEGDGNTHRYDPATNDWRTEQFLFGTYWFAATVLDGTLYACGGDQPLDVITCFAFSPGSGWTQIATLSPYRGGFALAGLGGKLYLSGGSGANRHTVVALDIASGNWSPVPMMPHGLERHAMVEAGGKIFVFGDDTVFIQEPSVDVYDPATDSWTELGTIPADLEGVRAAAAVDGRIYLAGDPTAPGERGRIHVFDPDGARWSLGGRLPSARTSPWLTSDGASLYVVGGFEPAGSLTALQSMEVYRP